MRNASISLRIAGFAAAFVSILCSPALSGEPKLLTTEVALWKRHEQTWEHTVTASPDARRIAYVALLNYKQVVVVDGKESPPVDGVAPFIVTNEPDFFVFSLDGKRLAYGTVQADKWAVVVDGVSGGAYDSIQAVGFSPDGAHTACVVGRGKAQIAIIDGVEGKPYDEIVGIFQSSHVLFSVDGRHWAYRARRGNKMCVVVDGAEVKEGDLIIGLCLSADGKRVAWTTGTPNARSCSAVVDGVERRHEYEFAEFPVFSPDGKRLAYSVRGPDIRARIVVDGREGPEYPQVFHPCFSPDGQRLAYLVRMGEKMGVVADGAEGRAYDQLGLRGLWLDLLFSPDSRHLAYKGMRDGKWRVVLDSKDGKEYDSISAMQFSPDGKHLAYQAQRAGKWVLVVDGIEGPEYESFVRGSRVVFDGPSSFHALAVRGGEFLRIEARIAEE